MTTLPVVQLYRQPHKQTLTLVAPRHPRLVKALAGVATFLPSSGTWDVHASAESYVKEMCRSYLGTDDSRTCDTVDVNVTFNQEMFGADGEIWSMGRRVVSLAEDGAGVVYGQGIMLVSRYAGRREGIVYLPAGAEILIQDVPKAMAEWAHGNTDHTSPADVHMLTDEPEDTVRAKNVERLVSQHSPEALADAVVRLAEEQGVALDSVFVGEP